MRVNARWWPVREERSLQLGPRRKTFGIAILAIPLPQHSPLFAPPPSPAQLLQLQLVWRASVSRPHLQCLTDYYLHGLHLLGFW